MPITELILVLLSLAFLYFLVLDVAYVVLALIGWHAVEDYVRRRPARNYGTVATSPLSPQITVLIPAHDEEATITGSIRALLRSHYSSLEVMVIDDGSTDGTIAALEREFDLVEVSRVPRAALVTKPVRQTYVSASEPRLTVLAKENGGKADALNAGLRYASTPLVCAIDADTMLDTQALARLVWEFESQPDTIAAGGIVRVLNGSAIRDGRIEEVRTPKSLVVNIQILEYLRAFLGGRIAWSRLGMLMIISGAFGLFRREAVLEAGGYDTGSIGEDAELVLRLHRTFRDRGEPKRIIFFPDPICWTEVPESLSVLARQRDRWQRGMIEMLLAHRAMMLRPRYGPVGMFAMPFFAAFEAFGPLIELTSYLVVAVGLATGVLPVFWFVVFLGLSVAFGFALSCLTLLMEERAYSRYPSWHCLRRLLVAAALENFGYRQLMAFVRARAWLNLVRKRGVWGEMVRIGFEPEIETPRGALPAGPQAAPR